MYFNKILKVLEDLQERQKTKVTSNDGAIKLCINKVSERFRDLDIHDRNMYVRKWPSLSNIEVLTYTLDKHDPDFSSNICSIAQAHCIPSVNDFWQVLNFIVQHCIELNLDYLENINAVYVKK